MGRDPVAGTARLAPMQVRLTDKEQRALDKQRGSMTRSDYVRGLIHEDGKRQRG